MELQSNKLSSLIENRQGGSKLKTILDPNQEVFKIKGQGLYAWCNESQYTAMLKNKGKLEGKIKFGQYGTDAEMGQVPQDTIDSYSNATTEAQVILWAVKFTDENIQEGTAKQIEKKMQPNIGTISKDGSSTEVFNTSIEKIKEVFNNIMYKSNRPDSYSLRESQEEAVEKMIKHFKNGGTEFLLGAIMRFGKNFTVLNVARELLQPGDSLLVATNKPGVFASLKEDITNHVYFDNYEAIELKKNKNFAPLNDKVNIIMVSSQLMMNAKSGDKVMNLLKSINFKLAFFDECHTGQDTEKFTAIEKSLTIQHIVRASGTPFKTLSRFTDENSFFYGYIEQQQDKKKGLNNSVTIESNIINVYQKPDSAFYSNEEDHTLRKMFATEKVNGEPRFLAEGEVADFIKDVLGLSNNKKQYSPMRLKEGLDHTVWLLPDSSDSVKALKTLIESITDEYNVFAATADKTRDIKEVQDAIQDHKEGRGKKTITLTIGRFVEGTTVPEWNGAFVMSDTSSLEKYFQFIFRICSPTEGKDKAYVFDFSKDRAFEMVYAFALATAHNNNNEDIQEIVRQWLDNNNIFYQGGVDFSQIEVSDILAMVKDGDFGQRALVRDHVKYTNQTEIANNLELLSAFINSGTGKHAKSSSVKFNVNQEGKKEAKNKRTINGRTFENKELTDLDHMVKNIVGLIAHIPYVFLVEEIEDKTIDGILNLSDDDIQGYFGVTKKDIKALLDSDVISDKRFVNLHF